MAEFVQFLPKNMKLKKLTYKCDILLLLCFVLFCFGSVQLFHDYIWVEAFHFTFGSLLWTIDTCA